ncbi:hypothetical protein PGTUg99_034233 [Puccinia graminis f. sp. tritici]|uniref:Uncharacterized protein n=1 Tax=Puccinia graminis f. sp. tritici TaxID=56615 RepID=A0A5B0NQA8_PUCGR|nr:hypothetical protein PGTUg99_034233 [Puccinia graminis f. sp. tritici]
MRTHAYSRALLESFETRPPGSNTSSANLSVRLQVCRRDSRGGSLFHGASSRKNGEDTWCPTRFGYAAYDGPN